MELYVHHQGGSLDDRLGADALALYLVSASGLLGFELMAVVKANPRTSEEEPAVWGPHVAECVMRGARLQWLYGAKGDFLWDIQEMFQHYVWVPWASPFPEVRPNV